MKIWKRLKKSNNETFAIFISTILGLIATPFFLGFEGFAIQEITYGLITLFGFISASSYLGKAIGKIQQHYKGEETNIAQLISSNQHLEQSLSPQKNLEGWPTLISFLIGVGISIPLVLTPGFSEIFEHLFIPGFAKVIFAFSAGGLTASLTSRVFRIPDLYKNEEEKKKTLFYRAFVIAALLLVATALVASIFFPPSIFGFAAASFPLIIKSIFTSITITSTAVSMFNYIGHVIDKIKNRNFSNETLGTIAGIFLGIGLAVFIISSSLATGGLMDLGIITAVGFSKALASLGTVLGQFAFGFFWASITTGFCRRMGTLCDQLFIPGKTIKDVLHNLFADQTILVHRVAVAEVPIVEENSIQKITTALTKCFKPGVKSYALVDDLDAANESSADETTSSSCFPFFSNKRSRPILLHEVASFDMDDIREATPPPTLHSTEPLFHRASTFNFG